MYLQRVAISNFRLMRDLALDLEPGTSVLFGENASGKSSVLALLDRVLGVGRAADDPIVAPDDLHVDPPEPAARRGPSADAERPGRKRADMPVPVSVTLTFAERSGARSALSAAIAELLEAGDGIHGDRSERGDQVSGDDEPHARQLRVRVRAHPDQDPAGIFELVDATGTVRTAPCSHMELAQRVRRAFPVVRLRADRRLSFDPGSQRIKGVRGLEETIVPAAQRMLCEPLPADAGDDADAVSAARHMLLCHLPELTAPGDDGVREAVQAARRAGAGAESLLQVLLLNELLRTRRDAVIDRAAFPIVLIEEAEAHLHPIALAGVWSLIESLAAQRVVTTNSSDLLAWTPLEALRRMARHAGGARVYSAAGGHFDSDERRRITHHISRTRSGAFFARCWLLVEGETEVWLLPELARERGIDVAREGIRCLEYAQCGVAPLIRLADHLGIAWHLLTDGDQAGQGYAQTARGMLRGRPAREHITQLREPDIELCLWDHGYADVFRRYAGQSPRKARRGGGKERARQVIGAAIRSASKPALALAVVEAAMAEGSPGVPPVIEAVLGRARRMARQGGASDEDA